MSEHPRSARGRRRRRRGVAVDYPPIRNIVDAASEAWALHQRFGRAHGSYTIGSEGKVLAGFALTGPEHTVEQVLGILLAGPDDELVGNKVLLVSARGDDDVRTLAEDDIAALRRCLAACAERGVDLYEWLVVGAEWCRPMRLACDPGYEWPALAGG